MTVNGASIPFSEQQKGGDTSICNTKWRLRENVVLVDDDYKKKGEKKKK